MYAEYKFSLLRAKAFRCIVIKMKKIPVILIALLCFTSDIICQITITQTLSLPSRVDNSKKNFFRPVFEQEGESCGNAASIGYTFTYEMACARGLSATSDTNQYPYLYTYHFLNGGSGDSGNSHAYVDAFKIARENGIPNIAVFGGFTEYVLNGSTYNNYSYTRWMSGYDSYYLAMQNRVDAIDTIDMMEDGSIDKLRQWLYDHGNGSADGGVANFGCSAKGWKFGIIPSGQDSGKHICTAYGTDSTGDHAQTIAGYDDSVHYDFNGDGKFSDTVDQNGDGKVGLADRETGALKIVNSWGVNSDIGDSDTYWLPYRLLATSKDNGGLRNSNRICIISVRKTYKPMLALKISITDSTRNSIALFVGASSNQSSVVPEKKKSFERQFTYSGGAYPMCGKGRPASIEIGLDISDLIDSIGENSIGKFFVAVASRGGKGTIDSVSLMDYTSGTLFQTRSQNSSVDIAPGTYDIPETTYIGIPAVLSSVIQANSVRHARETIYVKNMNGRNYVRSSTDNVYVLDLRGRRCSELTGTLYGWVGLPPYIKAGIYLLVSADVKNVQPAVKICISR
jgi:hypothetical protein